MILEMVSSVLAANATSRSYSSFSRLPSRFLLASLYLPSPLSPLHPAHSCVLGPASGRFSCLLPLGWWFGGCATQNFFELRCEGILLYVRATESPTATESTA